MARIGRPVLAGGVVFAICGDALHSYRNATDDELLGKRSHEQFIDSNGGSLDVDCGSPPMPEIPVNVASDVHGGSDVRVSSSNEFELNVEQGQLAGRVKRCRRISPKAWRAHCALGRVQVAFSPVRREALTWSRFASPGAKLWNLDTLALMRQFLYAPLLEGALQCQDVQFQDVRFSPNGAYVFTVYFGSETCPDAAKLWDAKTHMAVPERTWQVGDAPGHQKSALYFVAMSPDSDCALAILTEGWKLSSVVVKFDFETGKMSKVLSQFNSWVRNVVLPSQSGGPSVVMLRARVTGSPWQVAILVPTTDGMMPSVLDWRSFLDTRDAYSMAVSPNGTRALTGSLDGKLTLWSLSMHGGHNREHTFHKLKKSWALAFSPTGRVAVSMDEDARVRLWALDDPFERLDVPGLDDWEVDWGVHVGFSYPSASSVAFSPDGRTLLTGSFRDGWAKFWDLPKRAWAPATA